jgi:hypothetical protein
MSVRVLNLTVSIIPKQGMFRGVWLLVCVLVAGNAWGSCGDYLEHGPQGRITSPVANELGPHSPRQAGETPCQGPHCRSGHETPPTPRTPVPHNQSREQGVPVIAGLCWEYRSFLRVPWERVLDFPGYPPSIERPPRTA